MDLKNEKLREIYVLDTDKLKINIGARETREIHVLDPKELKICVGDYKTREIQILRTNILENEPAPKNGPSNE